jgi:hypothetical protein
METVGLQLQQISKMQLYVSRLKNPGYRIKRSTSHPSLSTGIMIRNGINFQQAC